MPYELQDTLEDFNNKYRQAVGLLTYKYHSDKKDRFIRITAPFKLDHSDGVTLYGYLLSPKLGKYVERAIPFENIESYDFVFPYTGWVYVGDNYYPYYVCRKYTRQYQKGYSSSTITNLTLELFRHVRNPNLTTIRNITDPNIINCVFNTRKFKLLGEIDRANDYYAVLSPNFLGVRVGSKWFLAYKTKLVGELFPFKLDPSVTFLEDLFYNEVN